jgi:fido (protein-threonine AMPylation protein)
LNPRNEETSYLKRLIEDFPADVAPNESPRAFIMIAARYRIIEQSFRSFSLKDTKQHSSDTDYAFIFKAYVSALHKFLFKDILSNAGEFRKASDPKGGTIGFGGTKHQGRQSKFKGTAPSRIEDGLESALSNLDYDAENPVDNALRFYQHFVYIHPFYDANGRIGRAIVSIYLHDFDLYVRWSEFDGPNNGKFISKLNKCHKRMASGHTFETYFSYLADFFKRYVISVDELSDFE